MMLRVQKMGGEVEFNRWVEKGGWCSQWRMANRKGIERKEKRREENSENRMLSQTPCKPTTKHKNSCAVPYKRGSEFALNRDMRERERERERGEREPNKRCEEEGWTNGGWGGGRDVVVGWLRVVVVVFMFYVLCFMF